jgi:hypothetical protein
MNKVNGAPVEFNEDDDYEGDEYPTTEDDEGEEDDSNEEEGDYEYDEQDAYLTETERTSIVDRNDLEWDDTSIELKIKGKNGNKSNKPPRSMSAQLNQFV